MKISGLDTLARNIAELEKAISELDGDIAQVSFDPHDPASIELAIVQLNAAIDERIAAYSHNEMVREIADEFKENGRSAILERAAAARLDEDQAE